MIFSMQMAYNHSVTKGRMFTCPKDVRGKESKIENEVNFYTSKSQAQQSVLEHVCVCVYTHKYPEGGWGK